MVSELDGQNRQVLNQQPPSTQALHPDWRLLKAGDMGETQGWCVLIPVSFHINFIQMKREEIMNLHTDWQVTAAAAAGVSAHVVNHH